MPRKKNFSPREVSVIAGSEQFERTPYFLGVHARVFRQNEKEKSDAQKSSQRSRFSILVFFFLFFFFHHKPKSMLKFLENGFIMVIVQKIRQKGLSHLVKMHFPVSSHVTSGLFR